ncbi:MAG: GrpB family protein [Bacteroidota bacterium]
MSAPFELAPPDPEWRQRFGGLGRRLRLAFGDAALRIDHIGGTALADVPARAIVDVQISVPALTPESAYREALSTMGFAMEAGHPDRTVRFFREAKLPSRVHLHVRAAGTLGEQAALLLRDYLRADADARAAFAVQKQALAQATADDGDDDGEAAYARAKPALLWDTLGDAHRWAQASGWTPGVSDA